MSAASEQRKGEDSLQQNQSNFQEFAENQASVKDSKRCISGHEGEVEIQQAKQEESPQILKDRSMSNGESTMFQQFLNEILDSYGEVGNAFKAIDRQGKGFIELGDLAVQLKENFGIEEADKQREIFIKIGHGSPRITEEIFQGAFGDIVKERNQHFQEYENMSGQEGASSDYERPSPFQDKVEREEIINVFRSQIVNLEEENKVEHFQDDSKYAPVIRRLRQQPNFNEFVRSYNSLQFPKSISPSNSLNIAAQSSSHLPWHRLDLFSQNIQPQIQQRNNLSPSSQIKTTMQTFSPNRFYQSLETSKEGDINTRMAKVHRSSGGRFLSPQYNRQSIQSYLTIDSRIPDQTQNKDGTYIGNTLKKQRLFGSQEFTLPKDFEHKRDAVSPGITNNQLFYSMNTVPRGQLGNIKTIQDLNGYARLSQSHFLSTRSELQQQPLSPNQQRLSKLKRKVNFGLESLQSVHHTSHLDQIKLSPKNTKSSLIFSPGNSKSSRILRGQFNQYMSMIGLATSTSGQGRGLEEEDRFGDILSRIQSTSNFTASNRSIERKRRFLPNLDSLGSSQKPASPYRNSQSPGGVRAQMTRVKLIQAALRSRPNYKKENNSSKTLSGNGYKPQRGLNRRDMFSNTITNTFNRVQ